MILRATTTGVLRGYRSDLMDSFKKLNGARDTVLTQRVFNSYAEDPAAASRSFQLRRTRMRVEGQYTVNSSTLGKYQQAWTSLDSVSKLIDTQNGGATINNLKHTTLKALNDPTGDAREQLGKSLSQIADTIIQCCNAKYGDNFVFAGADGANVPFEVRVEDGRNVLYYRGVSVDAAVPELAADPTGQPIECDANGVPTAGGGYYLKSENTSVMAADDYPDEYPLYFNGGNPTEFNADGTVYTGAAGETGGYYARVANPTDNGSAAPPASIPSDQLISKADYQAYCDAAGAGNPSVVTKDLVPPPNVLRDTNGDPVLVQDPATAATRAAGDCYLVLDGDPEVISAEDYEKAKTDAEKLDFLSNEKYFVDIGLGFKENEDGELIESSAFNAALNGINFLGYGLDEDGDPKNIYSLVQKMTEITDRIGEGQWSDSDYEEFYGLVGKLEDAASDFKTAFTNQSAATTKLTTNDKLLEEQHYDLQEQYSDLEDVEAADAITSFLWAQYSYNAALKVGNSILAQSLMDYMN